MWDPTQIETPVTGARAKSPRTNFQNPMETSNIFGAPAAPAQPAAAPQAVPAAPVQTQAAQTLPFKSSYTKENLLYPRVEEKDGKQAIYAVMKDGGELYIKAALNALISDPNWRASLVTRTKKEGGTYLEYLPGSYYLAIWVLHLDMCINCPFFSRAFSG